jgi:hypothetical protein
LNLNHRKNKNISIYRIDQDEGNISDDRMTFWATFFQIYEVFINTQVDGNIYDHAAFTEEYFFFSRCISFFV